MQKFLDLKTIISFILGLIIAFISSYYSVLSKVDIMEAKQDLFIKELRLEVKNIYDVLHLHNNKIKEER